MKLVISDAQHEGIKAATALVLSTTRQRCVRHWSQTNGDHASLHFQRNALAHTGKNSRRVISAFIATAFAQPDHAAAKARWRLIVLKNSANPKMARNLGILFLQTAPWQTAFAQEGLRGRLFW